MTTLTAMTQTDTTWAPSTSLSSGVERRERKLRQSVKPLLGHDENLIAAMRMESGPKTNHLLIVSLLTSPFIAVLVAAVARRNALLIQTDKRTYLYSSASVRPLHPTGLLTTVRCPGGPSLKSLGLPLERDWRIGDGWLPSADRFVIEKQQKDDGHVLSPGSKDVLARNRTSGWARTAVAVLVPILFIVVLAMVLKAYGA